MGQSPTGQSSMGQHRPPPSTQTFQPGIQPRPPDSSRVPAGTLQPAPISFPGDPITCSHKDIVQLTPRTAAAAGTAYCCRLLSFPAKQRTPGAGSAAPSATALLPRCSDTRAPVSPFTRDMTSNPARAAGQEAAAPGSFPAELSQSFPVLPHGKPFPVPALDVRGCSAVARGAGMAHRGWGNGQRAAATYRGGESRRHLPNLFGLSICVREERI